MYTCIIYCDVATAETWKLVTICRRFPLHRPQVDVLSNRGDTRLWDALEKAYSLITGWKSAWRSKAEERLTAENRRKADAARGSSTEGGKTYVSSGSQEELPILRILVLSDGKDTKSDASAHL